MFREQAYLRGRTHPTSVRRRRRFERTHIFLVVRILLPDYGEVTTVIRYEYVFSLHSSILIVKVDF